MLEEIFPNIAARGDINGAILGRSSWIVQPNESVRSKTDCQLPPQCSPSAVACPVSDRVVAGVS
jgi:hypothetical protein